MARSAKYFDGETELQHMRPLKNAEFAAKFGDVTCGLRWDDFSKPVAYDDAGEMHPVRRVIYYKDRPSLHKCDARCMNARGHNCECSCGGVNHGINA